MDFSPQQLEAMQGVSRWIRDGGQQVYRLFGYAGTGKTTLAVELAREVKGHVMFGAFTGKAALVMQQKGCFGAQTIHRMIYVPTTPDRARVKELEKELAEAKATVPPDERTVTWLEQELEVATEALRAPRFSINPESEVRGAALVVIDEVSMVGGRMGQDLLSFGSPVLVLGDPAQLPPVGEGGFFTKQEPDYLLTEIHRQAAGSPILQLASAVRSGRGVADGDYGESRVVPRGVLSIEDVASHDQVIVGTNKCRRDLNCQIRTHLGRRSALPEPGDKLVCLRNDYDHGMLNGAQWLVQSCEVVDDRVMDLVLASDGMGEVRVSAWRHHIEGREKELKPWEMTEHQAFDYAYAMTCHKAQGSQWGRVLVIDESWAFGRDSRRWLYTAITRAAETVTIVRKRP